jgi:23S rRNA (cytidine1920-2'-O)/16S rRNA (cytidine1409-2'-O)-methyltransferase
VSGPWCVLLNRRARLVFAVDAGYGQLRGDLRADIRVVNLERTNLGDVPSVLPRATQLDLVTIDLSYVSIADAIPQLIPLRFARDADVIALVKPMFELHLPAPPADEDDLERARVSSRSGS